MKKIKRFLVLGALCLVLGALLVGCKDNPAGPVEAFDCTGIWYASGMQDIIQIYLNQSGKKVTGRMFLNFNYAATINGDITNDKYFTFDYKQETFYGSASMGFQGRFYNVNGEWELRGIISGRIFITSGLLMIFDNSKYTFTRSVMEF